MGVNGCGARSRQREEVLMKIYYKKRFYSGLFSLLLGLTAGLGAV